MALQRRVCFSSSRGSKLCPLSSDTRSPTSLTVTKTPFCTLPPAPTSRRPGHTLMVWGALVPAVSGPAYSTSSASSGALLRFSRSLICSRLAWEMTRHTSGLPLKKDLAGKVARDGGGWAEHVENVTEAYNARPHEAVTVASEAVETKKAATFRVYQDNARKFKHNDELTRSRQRRLEEAGAFRAPTNAARSFQPRYGAVQEVSSYDSMMVRATDGSETLLKHALPVPRGSAEPRGRLTRPPVPLAVRQLRDFNPGPTAPP